MVADHRRFAWLNAMLTVLVALALLFMPAAGVEAMQCHDRPVHAHAGIEHPSIQQDVHASPRGGLHTPGHKSCCAVPCGFCLVLLGVDRAEAPGVMDSSLHFAWADQTGSGLARAPMLGPPRLPV
ncbi:hypothetical protein [Rhizobium mesosinicum]|uniref:DUF2946 domain-containing protein n=1 Tax=Rhizobium mesosinicum TaxID=335017 RepID=A0ABS7H1G2_9HYPH|nr:hypothetical protein [Rhizobium mesosinicum]MBW9055209.1 hypothetical protein [Rhizobium mesosinicum]